MNEKQIWFSSYLSHYLSSTLCYFRSNGCIKQICICFLAFGFWCVFGVDACKGCEHCIAWMFYWMLSYILTTFEGCKLQEKDHASCNMCMYNIYNKCFCCGYQPSSTTIVGCIWFCCPPMEWKYLGNVWAVIIQRTQMIENGGR
jgi:hypothetical protein